MSEYRALYRKWRPRTFDDVCGQDAITEILKYEVASNRISHAYLFCGSRGTGKTSSAKILAKAVNCEHPVNGNPCNECAACRSIDAGTATDVIEMDAASNNGVDNVRDLKEEIAFMPAALRFRVYIIDEVHMMSGSAFNALLKTLEEPPQYVVFILATTEFSKLPTTIVSRCQRFDFCRIATPTIMARLSYISEQEGISLTEDGARMIARAAQGGMRDAVSLLELCAGARKTVDAALVSETVGSGNRLQAYKMLEALAASDHGTAYGIIRSTVMSGTDLSAFWQDLTDAYRDLTVVKTSKDAKDYLDLTEDEYTSLSALGKNFSMAKINYHTSILSQTMADMQRAGNSKRSLAEIAVSKMCEPKLSVSSEALALRLEDLEKELSVLKLSGIRTDPSAKKENKPQSAEPEKVLQPEAAVAEKTVSRDVPTEVVSSPTAYAKWQRVLERIGELKRSLSVQFLNASVMQTSPKTVEIAMNPFFAKRLSANEADLSLLRGAIAECEGCAPSEITVNITAKNTPGTGGYADEIQSF